MGRYTEEIRQLERDFKLKYKPETAFGDPEVHAIQLKLDALQEQMKGKEECEECNGWGYKICDCCGNEGECRDCWCTGLVDAKEVELVS